MTASSNAPAPLVMTLSAETSDPFDALIRVLGDAQRYGCVFEKLEISTARHGAMVRQGTTALRLDLRLPPDSDIVNLRDRFSRHDALTAVDLGAR